MGSFTALRRSGTCSSDGSVQIKKLSEAVGLPLFEQVGRQHPPDRRRPAVYAGCGELFRALSDMERRLPGCAARRLGRLQLAVPPTAKHFASDCSRLSCSAIPAYRHFCRFMTAGLDLAAGNHETTFTCLSSRPMSVRSSPRHSCPTLSWSLPAAITRSRANNIPFARLASEPFLMREPGAGRG